MKIATRNAVFSYGLTAARPPGEENEPAVRTVMAGDLLEDDDPLVLKRPDMFEPYDGGEVPNGG